MSTKCKILAGVFGVAVALTSGIQMAGAQAQTPVKFVMDWAFEGAQSFWTLGVERGCYAKEGIDLTLDRGFGSGDSANKIASGAYDIGVVDFNTMVQFDGKNPDKKLIAIFIISDGSPMSVITLKGNGISKPQDLAGKRISDPIGEASRVMFPAFAKANGLDPNSMNWVTVSADLRQQLLLQKRTDAVSGHMFTIVTGLRTLGVKDEDMTILRYSDWGVDFYGNAVVTTPAWAAAHPKVATSFIRCAVDGIKASQADGKAAIASLKKRNPLLDEPTETASLDFSNSIAILTPNVKKNGLSSVTAERLNRTLKEASEAVEIPMPNLDDVWTDKYLPPRQELMVAP